MKWLPDVCYSDQIVWFELLKLTNSWNATVALRVKRSTDDCLELLSVIHAN